MNNMDKILKYGKRILIPLYAIYLVSVIAYGVSEIYGYGYSTNYAVYNFLNAFLSAGGLIIIPTVIQAVAYHIYKGVSKRFALFVSLQTVKFAWAAIFLFAEGAIYLTVLTALMLICETVLLAAYKKDESIGEPEPEPIDPGSPLPGLAFSFFCAFIVTLIFCLPFTMLFLLFWMVCPIFGVLSIVMGTSALFQGREKIGNAGMIKSVIAVIAPVLIVAVIIILFSTGVAVIRFM